MSRLVAERMVHECLGLRTRFVHRVVGKIYDDVLRPFGLGGAQLDLLAGVVLTAPVRPGELAEHLCMDEPTLRRNVQRLVAHGWIEAASDDGHAQQLRATRAGERLLERVRPAWERAQAQAAQVLGAAIVEELRGLSVGLRSP